MVWAIDGDGWPIDGLLVDADEGPPPAGYAVTHVAGRPVAELVAEHDQAKANESALRHMAAMLDGHFYPEAVQQLRDMAAMLDRLADRLIHPELVAAWHAQHEDGA